MNLNKEDLERMVKNNPQQEDQGPMPDTSYLIDDVKEMRNRVLLYHQKKIDRQLSENEFVKKIEKDYARVKENFPTIFDKVMMGTLELDRLEFMLKMIGEIKNKKVSKHEASVVVGQELVDNIVKPTLDK
jgi:hypothetical protein